jgi:hypothetical protein
MPHTTSRVLVLADGIETAIVYVMVFVAAIPVYLLTIRSARWWLGAGAIRSDGRE